MDPNEKTEDQVPSMEDDFKEAGFEMPGEEKPNEEEEPPPSDKSGEEETEDDVPDIPKSRFFKADEEEDPNEEEEPPDDPNKGEEEEETDPPPENLSEDQKKNWRTLRDQNKKLSRELADLRKNRGQQSDPEEVRQLKEQNQQLSDRLRIVDLQSHPEFQKEFEQPRQDLRQQIGEILKEQGVEANIDDIVNKEGIEFAKALSEVSEEMPGYFQRRFEASMEKLQDLEGRRKSALEKSGEVMQGLAQKSQQEQQQILDKAWQQVSGDNGAILQKMEITDDMTDEERQAAESFNEDLGKIRDESARLAMEPAGAEEVATSAMKARMFDFQSKHVMPQLEREYKQAVKTIRQLSSALKKARGHSRSPGRSGGGKGGQTDEKYIQSDDFIRDALESGKEE